MFASAALTFLAAFQLFDSAQLIAINLNFAS
jgi:hypothetical protein